MQVIGAGLGRTGTHSLKLALTQLGLGPCHHMEDVLQNQPLHVPLWMDALAGKPDWVAIYDGYNSAVDWPTAAFFRELNVAYPSARFVLTTRSPDSWVESFSETIRTVASRRDHMPPEMHPWLDMAGGVLERSGMRTGLNTAGLRQAFIVHDEAVKAAIPPDRLLIYEVKDGWELLCAFLGVPAPAEPFPRSNTRKDFLDRMGGGT